MSVLKNILENLLNKNEFCCLCLNKINGDPVRFHDEVSIIINNNESYVELNAIISILFSNEIREKIGTYGSICNECTKCLIESYRFIKTTQMSVEYLFSAIDVVVNNIELATYNTFANYKTLFISVNQDDLMSNIFFDETLKMYDLKDENEELDCVSTDQNLQPNLAPQISANKKSKKVKKSVFQKKKSGKSSRGSVSIPTSEMLYDKNDRTNLKCKECLKVYPTLWNLRNHFIRMHAPKVFNCDQCSRSYGSLAFLENHKIESHCTVVCSECGKTFHNRHTLKMHEIGHHLRIVCQDCGRVYKNKTTYKKHKELNVCGQITRADPSQAKYTCDYCNKKYTQKVSLRVHIQYEHGNYKAHECEWCGKKFWAQSRLKAHVVKHTKEKNFICVLCGGKFVTKESLLYHTRTHTGEKPYKCNQCDNTFLSASRRADHIKRHHTGATLECNICHCKFNTKLFLLRHKSTHMKCDSNIATESVQSGVRNKEVNKARDDVAILKKNTIDTEKAPSNTSRDLNIPQFSLEVFEDDTEQSLEDSKVYLEVPEEPEEYNVIKIKLSEIEA